MYQNKLPKTTHRRGFIGAVAAGAASLGLASLLPQRLNAQPMAKGSKEIVDPESPDAWFGQIKGKHRIIFDATHPEGLMPFVWPRVFLLTNGKTGSLPKDCSVVVVLRHSAIPFAFDSSLWKKYKFGESFKINDPATKAPAARNAFWQPAKGDFSVPGLGEVPIGINELQADGVLFCVCDMAITTHTAAMAAELKVDAAELKKEWLAAVLPGIMVAPSGVWAVGRAQEHGCGYCFVG